MSLDTIGSQIENPTNDRDHTTTAFTNKRRMNVIVVIIINGPITVEPAGVEKRTKQIQRLAQNFLRPQSLGKPAESLKNSRSLAFLEKEPSKTSHKKGGP